MTSFAKACVDLSNNLRHLRFSTSKSQTSVMPAAAVTNLVSGSTPLSVLSITLTEQNSSTNGLATADSNQTGYFTDPFDSSVFIPTSCAVYANHGFILPETPLVGKQIRPKKGGSFRCTPVQDCDGEDGESVAMEAFSNCRSPSPLPPNIQKTTQVVPVVSQRMSELRSRYMKACRSGSERSRSVSHANVDGSPKHARRGASVTAIKQRLFSQGLKIDMTGADTVKPVSLALNNKFRDYLRRKWRNGCATSSTDLWIHEKTLKCLFSFLRGDDLLNCSLTCHRWLSILISCSFMERIGVLINFRHYIKQTEKAIEANVEDRLRLLYKRRLTQIHLVLMKDENMAPFFNAFATTLREFFPDCYGSSIFSTIGASSIISQSSASSILFDGLNQAAFQSAPDLLKQNQNLQPTGHSGLTPMGHSKCQFCSLTQCISSSSSGLLTDLSCDSVFEGNMSSFGRPSRCIKSRVRRPSKSGNELKPLPLIPASAPSQLPQNRTRHIGHVFVDNCCLTDKHLEQLCLIIHTATRLSLVSCNDVSEIVLWSCLRPWVTHLTVADCINFSDESMNAITQLLPNLQDLCLQAYHLTDLGLAAFTQQQQIHLKSLHLKHCLDLTNQGVASMAHSLPNLQCLSLSGCSKLTDDAVDTICESLKHLTHLDLSFNGKITDCGLECIACDLFFLESLILDRCTSITELGIRHISTLPKLRILTLRWCSGLDDMALPFLTNFGHLSVLSIAGCKSFTSAGLKVLSSIKSLRRLEVTNSSASHREVKAYLQTQLPNCILLD